VLSTKQPRSRRRSPAGKRRAARRCLAVPPLTPFLPFPAQEPLASAGGAAESSSRARRAVSSLAGRSVALPDCRSLRFPVIRTFRSTQCRRQPPPPSTPGSPRRRRLLSPSPPVRPRRAVVFAPSRRSLLRSGHRRVPLPAVQRSRSAGSAAGAAVARTRRSAVPGRHHCLGR
jgi:hypothetical protein